MQLSILTIFNVDLASNLNQQIEDMKCLFYNVPNLLSSNKLGL